jgi:effector-binding domain-containing protein
MKPMTATPEIETCAETPYAAVRTWVTLNEIAGLGRHIEQAFDWLGVRGIDPAGPPFFRYNVIDMARKIQIDVGVPVAAAAPGDDDIVTGLLPAGRYATLIHVGHPAELAGVTETLLDWAADQGLTWDMSPGEGGEHWGGRVEFYLTNPADEPDMNKWVTRLAFRLAD